MVGWHTILMDLNFKQALGAGDGQRSLMCSRQQGLRESELTEPMNGTHCNWENVLSTDPDMSQNRTEKEVSLTWKDEQGQKELFVCVCVCVCVCVMGPVGGWMSRQHDGEV